jgi:pimeloyl-ACP methyl ester carboxylesterase
MVVVTEASPGEQTRARYPDEEGWVERDGVRVFWERYGDGETAFLLLPTSPISHSRLWKGQIPYLARRYRVLTFDPRGNGRSDRPRDAAAYGYWEYVADARAVLESTGTERAILAGLCDGGGWALMLASAHPETALGVAAIAPCLPFLTPAHPNYTRFPFSEPLDTDEGWAKCNLHYWRRDFAGFLEFFFSQQLPEPHSTKQVEDCVAWALETDPETLALADEQAPPPWTSVEEAQAVCQRITCPVLVVHGELDECQTRERASAVAELTAGTLVGLDGAGHLPQARHPVEVNGLLHDFAESVAPAGPAPQRWTRAVSRRRRALFVSSPIGLGHALRDVAIARELRQLVPDLEIDWLAQHPVTAVLEAEGERVHPLSAELANESGHIESESAEHDLHCFQAWRRMDEILLANFMVFHDAVREEPYDLWIGDEAWELDYYLHENPEEKRAAYVWLTDFVGWLPMPDGGEREAFLTTDYNAEMIEHIARFPRVRDRALFIGNPDDVVGDAFGPDLPLIRDWTADHFDFPGYVTGFDPAARADRERLRAELG